ncbi:hypothetical protein [Alteromonas oceanisediminis]|uniref:hypothetical protein n=1 Tax=Alteromonas oceanisediminis TaxID=2836180 RepID=UPI001BDAE349|nr:hypothetical protein [Alteromonas oceanisediminis]MBT0587663.1 hypothetical protein [Alteromonas oceanisediminis]
MTKIKYLLAVLFLIQGCVTYTDGERKQANGEEPASVSFGSTCHIGYCQECKISACPLGRQDLIGSACSCRTRMGVMNGVVGG